jgi:glycine/D-amino acid oxidase-like deaminating enzyme
MRLRTFESFWLVKNGILYSYPSLRKNIDAEIVVIGGGISGALTSHALMEKGYKVVLIDKRDIAMGSTAATTSMLQYEIDVPLYKLAEMIGEEGAVECYRAGIKAIHNLQKLVQDLKLNCGYQQKQSLYIAHNKKSEKWLRKEFALRDKHSLGVQWINEESIMEDYGLKTSGGILSQTAGSVDAYKLAHELIQLNVQRGMQVYDQTNITRYNFDAVDRVTLTTEKDIEVCSKKIIFCSGFETTELLKEKVATLFYTYASVSEEQIVMKEKLKNTLVWNTDEPYCYMRTTGDGRLLIGGEDAAANNSFFQQRIKERKSKKLKKKLEKILPGVDFIDDFNWGGTFGTTHDGLPYIGKSPEYKNALFVLGFGGNGITFSVQAMQIIPDLLEGKENGLAHYYRFGRKK